MTAIECRPGAFDGLVQVAFVKLNPHKVDTQCRAGDRRAAEAEERIGDGPDPFEAVKAQAVLR